MKNILNTLGKSCRYWRYRKGKITSLEVAKATGYSVSNINNFECGRVNNAFLLSWYISKGFNPHEDFIICRNPLTYGDISDVMEDYLNDC